MKLAVGQIWRPTNIAIGDREIIDIRTGIAYRVLVEYRASKSQSTWVVSEESFQSWIKKWAAEVKGEMIGR